MAVYDHITIPVPEQRIIKHHRPERNLTAVEYVVESPYNKETRKTKPKRIVIGYLVPGSDYLMHPNAKFKEVYPDEWEKMTGENIQDLTKKIGLFLAFQAIDQKLGLKEVLDSLLGQKKAESLIDFAAYLIRHKSSLTRHFPEKMKEYALYSDEKKSSNYYNQFFQNGISQERILEVKRKWIETCLSQGKKKIWLVLDGCIGDGNEINTKIITFSAALMEDGMPLSFELYPDSLITAKKLEKTLNFLEEFSLEIAGLLLKQGCYEENVIKLLQKRGIDYLILCTDALSESREREINEACKDALKLDSDKYWLSGTELFATQQEIKPFQNTQHPDQPEWLTLFYDLKKGGQKAIDMAEQIQKESQILEKKLKEDRQISLSSKIFKWVEIKEVNNEPRLLVKEDALLESLSKSCLSGLLCSKPWSARMVYEIYQSCSLSHISELFCQILKAEPVLDTEDTDIDADAFQDHMEGSLNSRFLAAFIAATFRFEIESAIKEKALEIDIDILMEELDKIETIKINEAYILQQRDNQNVEKFFQAFGVEAEKVFEDTIKIENTRLQGLDWIDSKPKIDGRDDQKEFHRSKAKDGQQSKPVSKKRGVPKGTKRPDINKDGSLRKKPGVKPGTKRGAYNKDGSPRKKPGRKSTASFKT